MKRFYVLAVLAAVGSLGLAGCEQVAGFLGSMGGAGDPKAVAQKFWEATKEGDAQKLKPLVTKSSLSLDFMNEKSAKEDGEFSLGEAKVEGEKASIPTTLKSKEGSFQLTTVLVKEEGKWKVDVQETMVSMFGGAMGEMMKGLEKMGEGFGKAMGEGLKGMEKGLEGAAKGMEEGLKEGMGEEAKGEAKEGEDSPEAEMAASYQAGQKVLIEWHGVWYPGVILSMAGSGSYKIHYNGYSDSWDEVVGLNRLKTQ